MERCSGRGHAASRLAAPPPEQSSGHMTRRVGAADFLVRVGWAVMPKPTPSLSTCPPNELPPPTDTLIA